MNKKGWQIEMERQTERKRGGEKERERGKRGHETVIKLVLT